MRKLPERYLLEEVYCDCHPETCGCKPYKITCGGTTIATGRDFDRLTKLVDRANRGWGK